MLAVLPFQNLSNDAAQEYFSDGLTEETITDLGEVSPEQLSVIARTSAMAYKHTGKTVTEIGRELGADYILEGSVRREGDTARVSAQLIRVQDQSHLWAHNYDREVGGLVTLENELGAAIAQQVQVVLTPHGSRFLNRHATNAESYELYLQGLSYLSQRTAEALKKSVDYFQLSTEKDPGFAPAYAGLAAAYNSEAVWSQQEFEPRAKVAAIRALDLDDGLAEAHAELGSEEALFEYDWPGAEREFKRALELNPNSADAHFLYSWNYLTEVGRTDEAIAEMKKALELDPLSPMYNTILGYIYYCARQYDHASQQDDKAIGLAPDFFIAYYQRATLLSQLGQYPDAITELTKSRLLAKDSRTKLAATADVSLRRAFAADGARGFWREIQREDEEGDAYHNLGAFDLPQAYAHLGEKENALKSLEEYYEKRNALMSLLKVDPAFDALRSDPRFVSLLRRMGLDR
jgi:TolB-like protein/Tfp pilus assembly protein PilF